MGGPFPARKQAVGLFAARGAGHMSPVYHWRVGMWESEEALRNPAVLEQSPIGGRGKSSGSSSFCRCQWTFWLGSWLDRCPSTGVLAAYGLHSLDSRQDTLENLPKVGFIKLGTFGDGCPFLPTPSSLKVFERSD